MFEHLSSGQRVIVDVNDGCFVVKACPGSGKTYSVAARIARLLQDDNQDGIAALSFTNVACEEILSKLRDDFRHPLGLNYPNYIGTLDSFFNNYVCLPYGPLIMGCKYRPHLVGGSNASWTKSKGSRKYRTQNGETICYDADPDYYFDFVSFNIAGEIIPIVSEREFHFTFKKYYNKDGRPNKHMRDLEDSKLRNFAAGFANQSDANYIALKVFEKY